MAMNRENVVSALQATTVGDNQKVESFLDECSKQNGFAPELLNIACDASIAEPVRQAAVIYLKNTIVRFWEGDGSVEKSKKPDFCLSDKDKALVRERIIDAVCAAGESVRTQLCIAIQQIIRMDFPAKWPQFVSQLKAKLANPPDASVLSAGLLIFYRLGKVYEYKSNKERDDIAKPVSTLEPLVYYHCHQLLHNQSAESVLIQIQGLKIFYVLIMFSLHFGSFSISRLDEWIKFAIEILARPCPSELDSIEDREERAHTVWWKCKKWAAKIMDRIFDRYGSPNQVFDTYAKFANHFLTTWSRPALGTMLMILHEQRNGAYVSDRVLYLALAFTNTAVAHSFCWKTMKPDALDLIKTVLFPLLSYTKEDEEMWEDNPEEYVRFKFDVFEDLYNPSCGASVLLRGLAKRKDIVQPVLAFAVQILQQSNNARDIEGALRVIGELDQQLTKSKKYKKDVERMLDSLIVNRLRDQSKFVRHRAAWCLKEYSDASFHNRNILSKVIEALIQRMCDSNEELPVKVESALAIQNYLENQERAHAIVKPHVRQIMLQIMEIVSKAQIDDVVSVVDELLEQFVDDIIPVAAEVAEHLSNLFVELLEGHTCDDRTPALNSLIPTLSSILDLVEDHREVMVHVEASVLKPINAIFRGAHIEFYDDVILLMQSLLQSYVSEPMWAAFHELYNTYKTCDRITMLPFSDISSLLHLYIVVDNESFLAFPERMAAMIDMCEITLQDDDAGGENHLYAAKILEVIMLECQNHAAEVVPTIIQMVTQRLMKLDESEAISELRALLFLVLVAALYACTDAFMKYISQIVNDNPLDYICRELVENPEIKLEGIHNRKMALYGLCILFQVPEANRPKMICTEPKKVLEACLRYFQGLQKALKVQAQQRKEEEESDEESEVESDDEGDYVAKKKKAGRRKLQSEHLSDDEDEIDEMSLDYIDALARESKREQEGSEDDDESQMSSMYEETESEHLSTKFDEEDGPDVFVFFKQTMEQFEKREPTLFSAMVGNLSAETSESLQDLVKVCEQHVRSEESKRVEQAGGYNFDAAAAVPASFNFTN